MTSRQNAISTNTLDNFTNITKLQNNLVNNSTEITRVTVNVNLQIHHNKNAIIDFIFQSFINQRKMYRHYIAETEYDNGLLTDEQFDVIEQSCIISLRKENKYDLTEKLVFLYDYIEEKYPEELNYIDNDDLADILGISKYSIKAL